MSILANNQLFVAGIMLYFGEGDKMPKNGLVRLGNVSPELLKIFISFLRKICKIDERKIKCYILLYKDLNNNDCINYWKNLLVVDRENFRKSQFIKGRHPKRKTQYGICYIEVCSQGLKEKIMTWIKLFAKYLNNAGVV